MQIVSRSAPIHGLHPPGRRSATSRPKNPGSSKASWVGGLAEWTEGGTAFLSVAFTWLLPQAYDRARWYRTLGYRVLAGGPATAMRRHYLEDVAELGSPVPDAIRFHNPDATYATRGCNKRCTFCNVWMIDGGFSYFPDFTVRPILCDANLAGLDGRYQDFIVERYQAAKVALHDANSGFEPSEFDETVFARWRRINRGPWRFGYDESAERAQVRRVMKMLRDAGVSAKRIRPYVLIGNEPFEQCLQRIHDVLEWGGEPHVQPEIKLNALEKAPRIRHDWSAQQLVDVARWANRRIWRYAPFSEYARSAKTALRERYDAQQGLFV